MIVNDWMNDENMDENDGMNVRMNEWRKLGKNDISAILEPNTDPTWLKSHYV